MGETPTTILFDRPTVKVGRFVCPSHHELWSTENRTGSSPLIVFPRVAVGIKQSNHSPVVATPNHVMFYNPFHHYRRRLIDPRGDECEFVALSSELLQDVMKSVGVTDDQLRDTPFQFSHAPCPASIYLKQRALLQLFHSEADIDPFLAEEQLMALLLNLLQASIPFQERLMEDRDEHCPWQMEQVVEAKRFMATNIGRNLKIDEIAAHVDCSVFHLCRIFKKFSGMTVHRFLTQCRLRISIERLLETDRSIIDIALDFGFSSHSHYTSAFRSAFGISPSVLRKTRGRALLN